MAWFAPLVQLAGKFKGAAAIFAFCILAFVLIISWLFGSNSFGTLFQHASSLTSREVLFLSTITILSIVGVIVLVIVLTYKDARPIQSSLTLYFTAHDSADPSRVIKNATIRLMLPEPITKTTGDDGTTVFVLPGVHARQSFFVNAAADGYDARRSLKIIADDGAHILLPLKITTRTSSTQPDITNIDKSIRHYLYISKTKLQMLLGQMTHANIVGGIYEELRYVESELRKSNMISIVPEIGRYFEGKMEASIGLIGDYIYIGGFVDDVLIALLGSPRHVIGDQVAEEKKSSRGFYAYLEPHVLSSLKGYIADNASREVPGDLEQKISNFGIGYFVAWINGDLGEGGRVGVRFVAQKIVIGGAQLDPNHAKSPMAVIGTPLYVAID
jgi:hypothetical protein